MNIRPVDTTWFELLTTHEELTDTLEALAHTGTIELEIHDHSRMQMDLQDLNARLQEYTRLERQYVSHWPMPDVGMSPFEGSPAEILDKALSCLYDWEKQAQLKIQRLEVVKRRLQELRWLHDLLGSDAAVDMDYQLLTTAGPLLSARLFLLPSKSRLERIPATVLPKAFSTGMRSYLLLVGTTEDLDALTAELAIKKYTYSIFRLCLPESGTRSMQYARKCKYSNITWCRYRNRLTIWPGRSTCHRLWARSTE